MKSEYSKNISNSGKFSKNKSNEEIIQSSQLMKIFEDLLKDMYWSEIALIEVVPNVVRKATSPELISSLTSHISEIKNQVTKVEGVFQSIHKEPIPIKSQDMKGLIRTVGEIMETHDPSLQLDLEIILVLQKVQHYKISSYAALCSFAKTLDEHNALALLNQTLDIERITDKRLCEIAQSINHKIEIRYLPV